MDAKTKASIEKALNDISSAQYGEKVRTAIVSALNTIVESIDTALNSMDSTVDIAAKSIEQNSELYKGYAEQAQAAADTLSDFRTVIASLDSELSSISQVSSQPVEYVEATPNSGVWTLPEGGYPKFISSTANGETVWTYITPPVPSFRSIRITRLNYSDFQNDSENFVDSVSYNPNEGTLEVKIADPISRLQIETPVYDYALNNGDKMPGANLTYRNGVPYLTLPIPRGPQGYADGSSLNYRPFVKKIWSLDSKICDLTKPTTSYFGEQVQLECQQKTSHLPQNGVITEYCMRETATPMFDAVIIRFRKSMDNNDPDNYKMAKTFDSEVTVDKNYDPKNVVSVFLPSGGKTMATMIDESGRIITRPVYWLNKQIKRVYWGGSRTVFPNTALFETGDTLPDGAVVKETYGPGGILFGHTKINGVGGDSEWAYWDTGDYRQTQKAKTKAGAWKNPQVNIKNNKTRDQFLIPIEIYGIIYQMEEQLSGRFGIGG